MKVRKSLIKATLSSVDATSGNAACLGSCQAAVTAKMAANCPAACAPQGRNVFCEDGIHRLEFSQDYRVSKTQSNWLLIDSITKNLIIR